MSKRERGRPKVFRNDPGGLHFDPYYTRERDEKWAHERGRERKILRGMGERRKALAEAHEVEVQPASRAPVTLPKVKWGRDDQD